MQQPWETTPRPLQCLLRKLTRQNATGGGGDLFIHTQTHACNCSGETVLRTPPQITARRNATAPQKSPVTTYPHAHATAYWKTLRLPTPKPTHAIAGGDLAHGQETNLHVHQEPATAQPPNTARRQHLLRNHLTKHRATLKKFLPSPFPESTNAHDMSLDVKNPCTGMQTPRPRLKGHDASLALTAAAEGLSVSLGHAQTCNSCKET